MLTQVVMTGTGLLAEGTGVLSQVVTGEMMSGALDEVIGLLPVAIPVMIGFIGIRKGIAFVKSVLASA